MLIILPIISALLLAAHFLRLGSIGIVLAILLSPALLFYHRAWVPVIAQGLLLVAAGIWGQVAMDLIAMRIAQGQPWIRMALILGVVALFTLLSGSVFATKSMRRRYPTGADCRWPSVGAFVLISAGMAVIALKVGFPMLLTERFLPGGGWLEILAFSTYGAWLAEKMLVTQTSPIWRKRVWLAFTAVFFAQLALGLAVDSRFLMTGDLHPPIPAMIIAGPIFRSEGFFMPVLFAATLLIVGPAWCSHLCYIGALDLVASQRRQRPGKLPSWAHGARWAMLAAVILTAIALRGLGTSVWAAAWAAIAFGVVGVLVMLFVSSKLGAMVHCVVYCQVGLVANWGGKLSGFRIRIEDGCNGCGKCTRSCRYDCLSAKDIENRQPGSSCTLCGDCLSSCREGHLGYRFWSLQFPVVRTVFVVLVVSLHAVFMAVARI